MNRSLIDFIQIALDRHYRVTTIADTMGNPFVVRYLVCESSEEGIEVRFYDRLPVASGDITRYDWEGRVRHINGWDAMPEILNLHYDQTLKAWMPNVPKGAV